MNERFGANAVLSSVMMNNSTAGAAQSDQTINAVANLFKYEQCDKIFTQGTEFDLYTHLTVILYISFYIGSLFDKLFKAGNLKRHKRCVHEKRKDFQCIICEKSFSQLRTLRGEFSDMNHII